jgi:hypothetical protein
MEWGVGCRHGNNYLLEKRMYFNFCQNKYDVRVVLEKKGMLSEKQGKGVRKC